MHTRNGNLHLEIQTSRKNPVGILRTSFRDKSSGKMRHTQHGRVTGCSLNQLKLLQLAFREKVVAIDSPEALRIENSRELGASHAVLQILRELGLHRALYSRSEPWVQCVCAMIVGRVIYQGSKLSLCNQWDDTCLWELCGVLGRPDVDTHCYEPLDRLLQRQQAVQQKLASKHLSNGCLVLYDITSTYFEGQAEANPLAQRGYSRDQRPDCKQACIGLVVSRCGMPLGYEVFAGNTTDVTTVEQIVETMESRYGKSDRIWVMDRGMVSEENIAFLKQEGRRYILGTTKSHLKKFERQLLEENWHTV